MNKKLDSLIKVHIKNTNKNVSDRSVVKIIKQLKKWEKIRNWIV